MYFYSQKAPHTNSSSVHEIIYSPDMKNNIQTVCDNFKYNPKDNAKYEWGWGLNVLITEEEKTNYMLAQIYDSLCGNANVTGNVEDIKKLMQQIIQYLEIDISTFCMIFWKYGNITYDDFYIDHQSSWSLPAYNPEYRTTYFEFIKDLYTYLISDEIVITISNDNGGLSILDSSETDYVKKECDEYDDYIKIPNAINSGIFGTIFDRLSYSANKKGITKLYKETFNGINVWKYIQGHHFVRFAFTHNPEILEKLKTEYSSSMPESIDLKITNKCNYGCSFCYMNSKPDGKHAKFKNIRALFEKIQKSCREVAIGGGEPTTYEDGDYRLKDICELAYSYGIKPNITTKNFDILDHVDLMFNAIGISISTMDDIYKLKILSEKIEEINKMSPYTEPKKLQSHIIVGILPHEETVNLIVEAFKYSNVLLLGYKSVGRGSKFKHEKLNILDVLRESIRKINETPKYLYSNDPYESEVIPEQYIIHKYEKMLSVDTVLKDELFSLIKTDEEFLSLVYGPEYNINEDYYLKESLNKIQTLRSLREGQHNLYFDAVTMKYGKSSWLPDTEMINFKSDPNFEEFKFW